MAKQIVCSARQILVIKSRNAMIHFRFDDVKRVKFSRFKGFEMFHNLKYSKYLKVKLTETDEDLQVFETRVRVFPKNWKSSKSRGLSHRESLCQSFKVQFTTSICFFFFLFPSFFLCWSFAQIYSRTFVAAKLIIRLFYFMLSFFFLAVFSTVKHEVNCKLVSNI